MLHFTDSGKIYFSHLYFSSSVSQIFSSSIWWEEESFVGRSSTIAGCWGGGRAREITFPWNNLFIWKKSHYLSITHASIHGGLEGSHRWWWRGMEWQPSAQWTRFVSECCSTCCSWGLLSYVSTQFHQHKIFPGGSLANGTLGRTTSLLLPPLQAQPDIFNPNLDMADTPALWTSTESYKRC